MAQYTIVDKENCSGCEMCVEIAPEIFGLDDEGLAESLIDGNTGMKALDDKLEDDLEEAYDECPMEAIKVATDPFNGDPNKHD